MRQPMSSNAFKQTLITPALSAAPGRIRAKQATLKDGFATSYPQSMSQNLSVTASSGSPLG